MMEKSGGPMHTYVYLVRHGESPKTGDERSRGLTERGDRDAQFVSDILKEEGIDLVLSSPYSRSVLTVEKLAADIGQEVIIIEDLKERVFSAQRTRVPDTDLSLLLKKSFVDPLYTLPGAESNEACQKRSTHVLNELLHDYRGKKIVIGSHGAVMTLMMNAYDKQYGLNFLLQTTKPDIYKMEFDGQKLVGVRRLWDGQEGGVSC